MQRQQRHTSRHVILLALLCALCTIGASKAATRSLSSPPLYRESPNARVAPNGEIRVDTDVSVRADEGNYRLPNATEPTHYDIELSTQVHTGDVAFSGTVKIHLTVKEATRVIVIHARQLTDFVATIRSAEGTATEEAMTYTYEKDREFLTLTPQRTDLTFAKGTNWILTIAYKGELRTDNGGFYLSTYVDTLGQTRHLATTQFESTDARHAFPCYDEPAKRATFTITINHGEAYSAISNMPVNTASSTAGRTVFDKTVNMPTYLIAFVVSDFEFTEGVLNAKPQRIYSRPGTAHEQEWALVSGMLILQRLAEYYNVEFTLPKIWQVAVPDFAAGAMENWGLATYREEYMLYNKDTSTTSSKTNIASIIAHEYTHQWFGDLVAIKWWTYLWLKEGFATLFSYHGMNDANPEWDVYQMMHTDDYQRALTADAAANSRPMTHYVQKPKEISSLYDGISYSKAGSVLSMFQNALTDKIFRTGLHNYLTTNQFTAAEEWQLFEAIQTAAKEENFPLVERVENMMSSWTQQGGYPLLTVTRNYDGKSFTIKQEAFYDNETLSTPNKRWYVPINYVHKSQSDFRNTTASHWLLKEEQISINNPALSADEWLILNKQSTGYYRINYDERNWRLITDGLIERPHKIHPRNRAQLMHDAYKLSSTNRLSQHILLDLMTYLSEEDQYAPWATANSIITTFNKYLRGDKEYDNFKFYIASLVSNIYDKLGVNDVPGEQHLRVYTRNVAINLACLAGIESCLQETNNKLKGYINDGIAIEPNLRAQTFCNGLRQSGDSEFDFVYNLLMDSESQALRRTLISSLGCAQKESHVKRFISSSIDQTKNLRTQERTTLLNAAYTRGEVGLLTSIDFLNDNWEEYGNLTPGFGGDKPLQNDIMGMANQVVNDDQRQKLRALVDKVKNSDKVDAGLSGYVEIVMQQNFNWLDNNREVLMSWVNKYRTGGSASLTASLVTICTSLAVLLIRRF